MLGMQGLRLDLYLHLYLLLYLHCGGFLRASARHELQPPSPSSIRSDMKKATRAQSGGFCMGAALFTSDHQ